MNNSNKYTEILNNVSQLETKAKQREDLIKFGTKKGDV